MSKANDDIAGYSEKRDLGRVFGLRSRGFLSSRKALIDELDRRAQFCSECAHRAKSVRDKAAWTASFLIACDAAEDARAGVRVRARSNQLSFETLKTIAKVEQEDEAFWRRFRERMES